MRHAFDVVIVGAGAVGLAVARRLAAPGRRVAVLEREDEGGGALASRAAAGMLAPQAEAREPDSFFELGIAARALFPAFARRLEEETGLGVDYRQDGLLAFAPDQDGESELARRAEWQRAAGLAVEELSPAEAAARWPGLVPDGALPAESLRFAEGRMFHFPAEAQVDGGRLVEALVASCAAAGTDLLWGAEARGLETEGDRVSGVRLSGGETVACGLVVNAAGAWAGRVAGWAGESVPVEPVRGEILAYATSLRPPRPILAADPAYCLLREDGRLLVGATAERAGFRAETTPEGQAWLERAARALAPWLAGRSPVARWVGLRPGTPDGLPVIGFSSEVRGLFHAAGHFRNGILLAPITAELVAASVEGVEGPVQTGPFAPERFGAALREAPA